MTEKEAGQFIKGLCGYAFDGVPLEIEGRQDRKSAYAYAKVALDVSAQNRENGKEGRAYHGGAHPREEGSRPQVSARSEATTMQWRVLLKGIVLSVAEEAERAAKDKAAQVSTSSSARTRRQG